MENNQIFAVFFKQEHDTENWEEHESIFEMNIQ